MMVAIGEVIQWRRMKLFTTSTPLPSFANSRRSLATSLVDASAPSPRFLDVGATPRVATRAGVESGKRVARDGATPTESSFSERGRGGSRRGPYETCFVGCGCRTRDSAMLRGDFVNKIGNDASGICMEDVNEATQ